jgi:hypothetical protein
MASPLNLDSRNYRQTTQAPEPVLDVLPAVPNYLGSMRASDAATLSAGMYEPPPPYPGSYMPGVPWRSVPVPPRKRGALRP